MAPPVIYPYILAIFFPFRLAYFLLDWLGTVLYHLLWFAHQVSLPQKAHVLKSWSFAGGDWVAKGLISLVCKPAYKSIPNHLLAFFDGWALYLASSCLSVLPGCHEVIGFSLPGSSTTRHLSCLRPISNGARWLKAKTSEAWNPSPSFFI